MKRQYANDIGSLVRDYLRQEGLETPLNEYRIANAWGTVMGEAIMHYTRSISVRNGKMYVSLSSSVLRQELMMQRTELVRRLNEAVKAQVITELVLG